MGNALQCDDDEIAFAHSALELSDSPYQKHQLHCDHSVTFRNGVDTYLM